MWAVVVVLVATAVKLYTTKHATAWKTLKDPESVKVLKDFVALKTAQANTFRDGVPPEIADMFEMAKEGDWLTLSNAYRKTGLRIGQFEPDYTQRRKPWDAVVEFLSDARYKLGWLPDREAEEAYAKHTEWLAGNSWQAITDVEGAYSAFMNGNEKYLIAYGRSIIDSMPPGSVYLSSQGERCIVEALNKPPSEDNSVVILNLGSVRGSKLSYERLLEGEKITIPTDKKIEQMLEELRAEIMARVGKTNIEDVDHRNIGTETIKTIFNENPHREFYTDEGYPGTWMYPNLEPHGLVMKLNREPVARLSEEVIQRDSDYWAGWSKQTIGDWLHDDTSLTNMAAFANKVFKQGDFDGFQGDRAFIENNYTTRLFSHARCQIARLYDWRMQNETNVMEQQRMAKAADLAYRQAWAMAPYSTEATYSYINFLLRQNRFDEAVLLAETMASMPQLNDSTGFVADTLRQLKEMQRNAQSAHH